MATCNLFIPSRRLFLGTAAFGAAVTLQPHRALAEDLVRSPKLTEGPFYPNKLPLDTDNDLLVINDGQVTTEGEIVHLGGKLLDKNGIPLKNTTIEIWQVDAHGVYLHSRDSDGKKDKQDKLFQGFGRFTTGTSGAYYFRTVKPVAYSGRTPHIHVKIKRAGKEILTTQIFVRGEKLNKTDREYNGIRDEKQRDNVTVAFEPIKDSKAGELAANFDVVLGITPEEK